jgi:hypothetical protein
LQRELLGFAAICACAAAAAAALLVLWREKDLVRARDADMEGPVTIPFEVTAGGLIALAAAVAAAISIIACALLFQTSRAD